MKLNYFLIPLAAIAVAVLGGMLTSGDMTWYKTIKIPSWAPPGAVIGMVWTTIFTLTAIAALLVWNKMPHTGTFWWIAAIFVLNGILNVFWSYLFFNQHLLSVAGWEAALLDASVIALIILIWPVSRLAAVLLLPYAGWTAFATYLTFLISKLNN